MTPAAKLTRAVELLQEALALIESAGHIGLAATVAKVKHDTQRVLVKELDRPRPVLVTADADVRPDGARRGPRVPA